VALHFNVDLDDHDSDCDDASPSAANGSASGNVLDLSCSGNETDGNATLIADSGNSREANHELSNNNQPKSLLSHKFRDLPLSSRGPLRIEPIYENNANSNGAPPPMSLLTAGWRTDGMALADAARELMMEEVRLYCLPSSVLDGAAAFSESVGEGGGDGEGEKLSGEQPEKLQYNANINAVVVKRDVIPKQPYHGRRIAEGLSYHLSKCVFSEGVRSLSSVGLLASASASGSTRTNTVGSLHLIDATGTHRVRAHAIGSGSSSLHKRLVFVDFDKMDCREGLKVLLRLIAEEGGLVPVGDDGGGKTLAGDGEVENGISLRDGTSRGKSIMAPPAFVSMGRNSQQKKEGQSTDRKWNLPSNTAAELAVLKGGEGRMRRVRLSSLFFDNQH